MHHEEREFPGVMELYEAWLRLLSNKLSSGNHMHEELGRSIKRIKILS
jgi:hypothetical protein